MKLVTLAILLSLGTKEASVRILWTKHSFETSQQAAEKNNNDKLHQNYLKPERENCHLMSSWTVCCVIFVDSLIATLSLYSDCHPCFS